MNNDEYIKLINIIDKLTINTGRIINGKQYNLVNVRELKNQIGKLANGEESILDKSKMPEDIKIR